MSAIVQLGRSIFCLLVILCLLLALAFTFRNVRTNVEIKFPNAPQNILVRVMHCVLGSTMVSGQLQRFMLKLLTARLMST